MPAPSDTVAAAAPTGQRRRGARLEDAILDAAWDELVDVGWTAFAVENVATRARTGKASIYRRWPTKQQLVADVLAAKLPLDCGGGPGGPSGPGGGGGLPGVDPRAWGDDLTTADALRLVGRLIADTMGSPVGQAIRAVKFEAASDPDFARLVDERFQAPRRAMLMQLLRRGVERGEVRPDAVSATVADVLPAVLVHRVAMQGEALSRELIEDIVENVLIPLVEAR